MKRAEARRPLSACFPLFTFHLSLFTFSTLMSSPAWLSAFILLLLVLDPLGNVPTFMALLKNVEAKRRHRVILREYVPYPRRAAS